MPTIEFDASQYEPTGEFEPIPAGNYPAMVTKSDMKPTKDGHGQFLELTVEIIEGPYKGRKIFDRLNLVNKNEMAVEIAYRTLSAICYAAGKIKIKSSEELHNIPMTVKLKHKPASGDWGPSNEISAYKKIEGPTEQHVSNPVTAPPITVTDAPPWEQAV